MDAGNKKERPPNPRANANIFKVLTFSWILNLFKTGKKRDLEMNDLHQTLKDHKSSSLGNELEKRWTTELSNAKMANREPSLLRVLIKMIGPTVLFYASTQTFAEIVVRMSQPALIGGLLLYFNPEKSSTIDSRHAYIYASGLVLSLLVNIMLYHFSQVEMRHCGMKMRVACCSIIFKKALRLSKTSLGETTIGQIVNLLSNDVNRFDFAFGYIHFLWIGPIGTIVVTYFLWQQIGVSSLFGVALLLGIIPLQGWLGKKTSEFRLRTAPKTDERVRLMNEIVSGIQVIKMYTWEKPFAYLVQHTRKLEIEQLRGVSYIRSILDSFKIFHTRFALFISILAYVLLGNFITTQKVFVIISYYQILLTNMTIFFPMGIGTSAELMISIKRIQSFLLYDEKDKPSSLFNCSTDNVSTDCVKMSSVNGVNVVINNNDKNKNVEPSKDFGINISNASAKWIDNQTDNSLNDISLTVKPGRLVAIVGPVGSGKSSLLQVILRELPLSEGNIYVRGVVSYASQEPWLFNGSVRQNILFGSPMNEERYKQVVKVCALKMDFEQLPHGDKTVVGERGVSISGGQRARINLARAVYKRADIYLLDDPLSAVDTHVGSHLFEKCIKGYLKDKTCILVTHQIQYLLDVDQIVLMENGNVLAEGSYQELQSSSSDLRKLLGSSEQTTTVYESNSDNTSGVEPPLVSSRQDSVLSSSLSVDEKTCTLDEKANSLDEKACILDEKACTLDVKANSLDEKACTLDEKACTLNGSQTGNVEMAETCSSGNISRNVYFSYFSAGGNVLKISLLLFTCVFTQILGTSGDYWISYWVDLEDHVFHRDMKSVPTNGSSSMNDHLSDTFLWWPLTRQTCVWVYAVINFSLVVFILIRCFVYVSFTMEASSNLHNNMFNAIIRATMYFFNTNSSGRILNRFTKDMGAIDEMLPVPLMDFMQISLSVIGTIVVVGLTNVYLLLPTFVVGLFSYYTVKVYLSTSRSIKRLEGVSRSPVFAHFNACLQGLTTIRAFRAEDILSAEFDDHQDLHSSAFYLFLSSNEAFGFTLDMICLSYIIILTYSFLIVDSDVFGGNVGLILTQTINLTGAVQWGIRQAAEVENQMTAVERVLEYTNSPQEAALESLPNNKPAKEWPDKGKIVFKNFYLRYGPNTPYVLKNINVTIQPTEKIGVVGRTGAGKSSLIGALFRLALNEGEIIVDDVEIHTLGLHELRSKFSIIPQEPVLFSGTLRKNLDPFDEHPDHVLWNALDEVELKRIVMNLPDGLTLDSKVSDGGSNFSVGQRQLVCLARAIVRSNKFLILDEATANVDTQTDVLIQNTIRDKFRSCTVLTIAHRLNTVMDSDKVLVMNAGSVVEFDHPYNLLKDRDGYLYKMVEQTGRATADLLRNRAAESYKTTNSTTELPGKLIVENPQDLQTSKKND